jgi:hypothetical protein
MCIYWILTQNTEYTGHKHKTLYTRHWHITLYILVFCVNVQYIQCSVLMFSTYSAMCLCPGYTVLFVNVQYIHTEHWIYWTSTQNTVYTGHQHRTLYILDILYINTEHCVLCLCPGYTVFCVYVQDIQCSVLMSRIYSVLCLCPGYTVLFVNVQYIQFSVLMSSIYSALNINTEHCIYWTSIQNTVYTVHQHRTLYVLDINRKHCIYWTLTLYTVYTGVNVQDIQCSVFMSRIYSVIC